MSEYLTRMKSKGLSRKEIPADVVPKFWSKVKVGDKNECWPWTGTTRLPAGYGQMGFNHRYSMTHILAFVLTKHDVAPGMCVLHSCDNPPCCNPEHLWCGTYLDNNRDRDCKGRAASHSGTLNGRARLSEAQIIEIRAARVLGSDFRSLADKYGVAVVTIAKIVQRRLWKHL